VTLYDAVRSYAGASLRLATLVQREVLASLRAEGTAVPDLGVHTDVGFGSALTQADREYGHLVLLGPAKRGYLDTPTMAPAALIEPLFLTDPPEASVADSRAGQEAIGRGLADAVAQFFTQQAPLARDASAPAPPPRAQRIRCKPSRTAVLSGKMPITNYPYLLGFSYAPERIRTSDLRFRSLLEARWSPKPARGAASADPARPTFGSRETCSGLMPRTLAATSQKSPNSG
jgi:hypothetical protein